MSIDRWLVSWKRQVNMSEGTIDKTEKLRRVLQSIQDIRDIYKNLPGILVNKSIVGRNSLKVALEEA